MDVHGRGVPAGDDAGVGVGAPVAVGGQAVLAHVVDAATFSNEQAIREIYLKPFQTCIEERGTTKIKVQNFDEATGTFTRSQLAARLAAQG